MRAVIQRVERASVEVAGEVVGSCGTGYLVLLGVGHADTEATAEKLWKKICTMRIFADENGARRDLGEDRVGCGIFGADMRVSLVNDGPFTVVLDTDQL